MIWRKCEHYRRTINEQIKTLIYKRWNVIKKRLAWTVSLGRLNIHTSPSFPEIENVLDINVGASLISVTSICNSLISWPVPSETVTDIIKLPTESDS